MKGKSKGIRFRIVIEFFILVTFLAVFLHDLKTKQKRASVMSLYYKGKTLEAQQKYDEALEVFKRVIELNPNLGKAHLMLGVVYNRKGEFEEAEKEYRKALKLDMSQINKAITHHNLGVIYLEEMGLYNKAISEYKTALKIYPKVDSAYNPYIGLARAYIAKGEYDEAIRYAKESIKSVPNEGKGYFNLGLAYLLKQDIDSAESICEKLKNINKNLAVDLSIEISVQKRQMEEQKIYSNLAFDGNAASFYRKANSMLFMPHREFRRGFNKRIKGIINKGWLDGNEDLMEILTKNREAINLFKKATKLSNCNFMFGKSMKPTIEAPILSYWNELDLAKLILVEARFYEKKGRLNLALDNYLSVLRFANHLGQQKFSILISKVTETIVQKLLYIPLTQYINRRDINIKDLGILLDNLLFLNRNKTGLENAFIEEREWMRDMRRKLLERARQQKDQYSNEDIFQKIHLELTRLGDKFCEYLIVSCKENRPEMYKEKIDQFRNELKEEIKSLGLTWEEIVRLLEKGMNRLLEKIKSPSLTAKILFSIYIGESPAKIITSYYVSLAELNILITATAVKLYKLKTGKIPDSLKDLVPTYLPNLPQDPFNEFRPLQYRHKDDKWIIYSFGPDKQDNQGSSKYDEANVEEKGDIIFSSL